MAAKAAAAAADAQPGSKDVNVAAATQTGIKAATDATSAGITSSSALSQLVTYIPTETIALWLAVQTALGTVAPRSGQAVCDTDFKARWIWFCILLAGTAALTIGLSHRKQKEAGQSKSKKPVRETIVALLAFSAWSLSLTNSPLQDICAYEPERWGPVLLLGGTILVAAVAYVSGITVRWEKVLTDAG